MGEKSHSAQNSLIGLLTGRIVSDSEIMTQVLVNDIRGNLGSSTNMDGFATSQELTEAVYFSQAMAALGNPNGAGTKRVVGRQESGHP